MFYSVSQNNSGAYFITDAEKGVGAYVVVEAGSSDEAKSRFDAIRESYGAGFDSYCSCCGLRWWESFYDDDARATVSEHYAYMSVSDRKQGFVHYADGRIVPVGDAVKAEADAMREDDEYYD